MHRTLRVSLLIMQIKGKVAIVTGGAGALGQALVEALLQQEAKVYIFDTHSERGRELENTLQTKFGEDRVWFQFCDVSDDKCFTDAFQAVVTKHGQVDVMVNNAAIVNEKRNIDKVLLINLGGTIRGSNLAIRHMRKDEGGKGGVIINVSSISAAQPFPALPAYVSTKQGVSGFTRSWAANPYLKEMGLRFGQLCPFAFDSFIVLEKDKQMLYPNEHMQLVMEAGVQKVEDIAAGLIEVLEDDDSNGVMLFTHPKDGTHRKRIEAVNE